MIQEPEVFAIHHADLAQRAHLFGRDFLGRVLFACVLGAPAYVQADRVRRRMIDEMLGVLESCDALVTIGPGPAPRFDAERTFGFIHGLWGKQNLTSPFSVTGFPALSLCTGFARGVRISCPERPLQPSSLRRTGPRPASIRARAR